MNTFILLALFSGIAVTSCFFAACYFFFINRDRLIHLTLGILFLSIGLRIGKSIFFYLLPEVSLLGVAFGFLGLSLIGPSMSVYMRLSAETIKKYSLQHLLHLIVPVSGFVLILLGPSIFSPSFFYKTSTGLLAIYLIDAWRFISLGRPEQKSWNMWLVGSMTFLWLALGYQHISDTILNYAFGAAFAALIVYSLIFKMLKNPTIFQKKLIVKVDQGLIKRVVDILEDGKFYQNPALNLSQFASHLDEPVYMVSKAVKRHYGRNFPEVVNSLRIEEVKKQLQIKKDQFVKVEGLAYEAGFNTPSAFYAAFKKETASSPREYQKSLSQ